MKTIKLGDVFYDYYAREYFTISNIKGDKYYIQFEGDDPDDWEFTIEDLSEDRYIGNVSQKIIQLLFNW